jgi:hypothetical protein
MNRGQLGSDVHEYLGKLRIRMPHYGYAATEPAARKIEDIVDEPRHSVAATLDAVHDRDGLCAQVHTLQRLYAHQY